MIFELFLWFIFYSLIGWAYESVFYTIVYRKPINSGFLTGPFCPVYGFGAVLLILAFYRRIDNIFLLFFVGMVTTTALEYLTAVILEKCFRAKWWDYSCYPLNFQGRICLLGALVFGVMSVALIKFIHPAVLSFTEQIPQTTRFTISAVLFVIILLDLFFTVRNLFRLNGTLKSIQTAINCYMDNGVRRAGLLKAAVVERFEESEFFNERFKGLLQSERRLTRRLVNAFPKLRSLDYEDAWQKLKNHISRTVHRK